jgi:cyclopropane-fatty-acyl-phospholipid synthase
LSLAKKKAAEGCKMDKLFQAFLAELIKTGSLKVKTASGHCFSVGDGSGQTLALCFNDAAAQSWLMINPELHFGALFADGRVEVSEGAIFDVLMLASINLWRPDGSRWVRLLDRARFALRRFRPRNDARRARRNVGHHYDLNAAFYKMFLDPELQYSCAYFASGGESLENAQLAKKRHIAAKLMIDPGQSVLDIGCGFGGLAFYLARFCGANVSGVTLSKTQHDIAKGRAADLDLAAAVHFHLLDYREVDGRFDRIVSVGMFEHVGLVNYGSYFRTIAQLLDEDGIALVHTIGRATEPAAPNPWIAKYVFPGSYIPSLSEILPAIENAGLFVTDIEVLRLHYAETLKIWRERFLARREEAKAIYGERFCRMWEFYLAGTECSFRCEGLVVFQIQLAKKLGAVPITRDYISRGKAELQQRDSAMGPLRMAGE